MGRLFWKLFLAFFLALISTDLIVGNIVEWQSHQQTPVHHEVSQTCASESNCETKPIALKPESQSAKSDQQLVKRQWFSLPLYVLIYSLISSTIFAGVLAWSISHPIKLLLEHLKSAAEGDLLVRVSPKITASHDEFSELGEAFDLMALRLNNMIKSANNPGTAFLD